MTAGDGVFWVSLFCLAILSGVEFRRAKNIRALALALVTLALCGTAYYYAFHSHPFLQEKGSQSSESAFIIALYLCMLLGMLCHYLFALFVTPKEHRAPFDFPSFLAPIFASPIVFIPLLGALQSGPIDLAELTVQKTMVFLVAFQNGFFWKELFDNQKRKAISGSRKGSHL
jgi:hypothetical protein